MSTTAVLSQGCGLYVLDDTVSPAVIRQLFQTKGVSGLGGSRGVIDITNLDSAAKEKLPALIDNGSPSFDIVYNPQDAGQQLLETAAQLATKVVKQFYLGLSDGVGPPTFTGTIAGANLLIKQPNSAGNFGRTGYVFSAFVKQFARDIQVDGVVMVKAAFEVTGLITTGIFGKTWS